MKKAPFVWGVVAGVLGTYVYHRMKGLPGGKTGG